MKQKAKVKRDLTLLNFEGGEIIRYSKEDEDNYFVYAKGLKSRGWRFSKTGFYSMFEPIVITEETKNKKWLKQILNIEKYLEVSGLWANILKEIKILKQLSYKAICELSEGYWCNFWNFPKEEIENEKLEERKRLISKYPIMFDENNEFKFGISEWMLNPKIKTMNFGKYNTTSIRNTIQEHFNRKEKYSTFAYVNYDVSFNYNPKASDKDDVERAWYSEEYKGCGNGHYYIALDNIHALFCEDD